MEQNDVGFDAEGLEVADALFVMGEESGIEAIEIKLLRGGLHIGEARRDDTVEDHPLGEDEEAHLIKGIAG